MRGQRHAPAAFYPGKDPESIVQEVGWAPGPVWIGAKNLAFTGIRSLDRPARSQLLYRLRYPACCVKYLERKYTPEHLRARTLVDVPADATQRFIMSPL
jgi:hypothetical protein